MPYNKLELYSVGGALLIMSILAIVLLSASIYNFAMTERYQKTFPLHNISEHTGLHGDLFLASDNIDSSENFFFSYSKADGGKKFKNVDASLVTIYEREGGPQVVVTCKYSPLEKEECFLPHHEVKLYLPKGKSFAKRLRQNSNLLAKAR